jgi:hypothetical protein
MRAKTWHENEQTLSRQFHITPAQPTPTELPPECNTIYMLSPMDQDRDSWLFAAVYDSGLENGVEIPET